MSAYAHPQNDDSTFHSDVAYIEAHWQRRAIGATDMQVIEMGQGNPIVFVPILEHLEFVYARQLRTLSQTRRVILYRRHESRTVPLGLAERAEELRQVLDSMQLEQVDLAAHGDAAMILFEFAIRYPKRCRSLVIIAQAADYQIAPHPFIWLLHEIFVRLPIQYVLPAWFLRRIVVNYIVSCAPGNTTPGLPRHLIDAQFRQIERWPFVYKFSVLPIIHYFDLRKRLSTLTMPILLINRADDVLSPEQKTRWLAEHLPHCGGYYVIAGKERFFMYSQAETVTPLIETFLRDRETLPSSSQRSTQ